MREYCNYSCKVVNHLVQAAIVSSFSQIELMVKRQMPLHNLFVILQQVDSLVDNHSFVVLDLDHCKSKRTSDCFVNCSFLLN